jgi:branched-chain amino acid transport system permease protein
MAGVMYALVALGFVLIFKASGIFNYAQGVMALFAAMTLVGIQEGQVPFAHLINAIFGTDIHYFGWEVPALPRSADGGGDGGVRLGGAKVHLPHLVGQEPIILFMATIGLAYFLEGFGRPDVGVRDQEARCGSAAGHQRLAIDEATFGWFGYGFFIDNLDISRPSWRRSW